MKNILAISLVALFIMSFTTQNFVSSDAQYKDGEYLKYRVHYLGLTGGYATLDLDETTYNSSKHYHATGKGWTVGAAKLFFKVSDNYQTYFDKSTYLPSKFIRKIDEGGYKKDKVLYFNQSANTVKVQNNKDNWTKTYSTNNNIQDMLSAFYYLRSKKNTDLKTGSVVNLDMFMDEENYPFQLKVLGRDVVKCKYGKVKCIKIRPYVQSGRVFKAKESVTMWVTDDANMVPILIKAELAVGSLKAEIYDYKNVTSTINFY